MKPAFLLILNVSLFRGCRFFCHERKPVQRTEFLLTLNGSLFRDRDISV